MQEKIKEALANGFERRQISLRDLMILLTIFSTAKNEKDLRFLVDLLKDDYGILADLATGETMEIRKEMENEVQDYIKQLIKTDPVKAMEISRAAMERGMTKEKLAEKFPEINQHLKNKNK